jgi:hypothetical protein
MEEFKLDTVLKIVNNTFMQLENLSVVSISETVEY